MRNLFRFLWFVVKFAVISICGAVCGAGLAGFLHFSAQVPELQAALDYHPSLISKVYDRDGNLLAEFASERRILVPISQIPQVMQDAIIAIEDEHFYSHRGLDILGIFRAAWSNFQAGTIVQGGSTLTQQLSKSLFLSPDRSLTRKIREALVALQLEKKLTKSRILELYLNQVYFGSGAYGIESATRTYFDKSCSDLDLPEAALLAGLPKAPSRFTPLQNPDSAIARRNLVLNRMEQAGYISRAELNKALATELKLNPGTRFQTKAPYFVEVLRRNLEMEFGSKFLYSSGAKIYTHLDLHYQKIAEKAMVKGLHLVTKRRGWRGPVYDMEITQIRPPEGFPGIAEITDVASDRLTIKFADIEFVQLFKDIWIRNADLKKLVPGDKVWFVADEYENLDGDLKIKAGYITQEPQVEASLLSVNPKTGETLAWIGGYNFKKSQFDRVSQSRRQPGSAFKPFIYAAALDEQYTNSDIVYDTPIVIEKTWGPIEDKEEDPQDVVLGEDGEPIEEEKEYWKPHNYSEEFYGPTTLRMGLSKSRNIISIHLLEQVGVSRVIRMARQMGITSPLSPTLSLALGSSEMTLMELVRAYGGFATMGSIAEPMMISRIEDRNGKIVREYYPAIRNALSPETAFLTNYLLQGVIQHGTGVSARVLNRQAGGKTGTTNSYHDAWFIGFTPEIVTGVWVGADMAEPIYRKATGASTALPIWLEYMKKVLVDYPPSEFYVPKGIVFADVCMETGQLVTSRCPRSIHEAFRDGTEPLRICEKHGSVSQNKIKIDVSRDWDNLEDELQATPTPAPMPDSQADDH